MGVAPKLVKWVKSTTNAGKVDLSYVDVPGSGRSVEIVPGRWIVQHTAGDNTKADGCAVADTHTAPGRKILGLCVEVRNTLGVATDRQYLGLTDAGRVGYMRASGNVFAMLEDGAGGTIDLSTDTHARLVLGTVSPGAYTSDAATNFPAQYSNDKLDSDLASAVVQAFKLIGVVPELELATATNKVYEVEVDSTYAASV